MGAAQERSTCAARRGVEHGLALALVRPGIIVPYHHGMRARPACRGGMAISAESVGGSGAEGSESEGAEQRGAGGGGKRGKQPLDGATETRRGHGGGLWNGIIGAWEDREFDKAIFSLAIPALGSLIIEPVSCAILPGAQLPCHRFSTHTPMRVTLRRWPAESAAWHDAGCPDRRGSVGRAPRRSRARRALHRWLCRAGTFCPAILLHPNSALGPWLTYSAVRRRSPFLSSTSSRTPRRRWSPAPSRATTPKRPLASSPRCAPDHHKLSAAAAAELCRRVRVCRGSGSRLRWASRSGSCSSPTATASSA